MDEVTRRLQALGVPGGQSARPPKLTTANVLSRFEQALRHFMHVDRYLLDQGVGERAMTHKLGEYVQAVFPQWNVDCEYNRNFDEPKRVLVTLGDGRFDGPHTPVPDIIVHRRGSNAHNLLMVEVKKQGDPRASGEAWDKAKLQTYARLPYRYAVGAFVELGVTDDKSAVARICVFEAGVEQTAAFVVVPPLDSTVVDSKSN